MAWDKFDHQKVVKDIANGRKLHGPWLDDSVHSDASRLESHRVDVVEGPDEVSEKVAIVSLLPPYHRESGLKRHQGVPNYFLILL